ncbi:hypothetical protein SK128_025806 [Halocaridina rubra]|uniref:Uncharacterized protein n=1 Tax=Halocaridina rubra TaxID=373956 RepID=A0AAN9A0W8_HALRR
MDGYSSDVINRATSTKLRDEDHVHPSPRGSCRSPKDGIYPQGMIRKSSWGLYNKPSANGWPWNSQIPWDGSYNPRMRYSWGAVGPISSGLSENLKSTPFKKAKRKRLSSNKRKANKRKLQQSYLQAARQSLQPPLCFAESVATEKCLHTFDNLSTASTNKWSRSSSPSDFHCSTFEHVRSRSLSRVQGCERDCVSLNIKSNSAPPYPMPAFVVNKMGNNEQVRSMSVLDIFLQSLPDRSRKHQLIDDITIAEKGLTDKFEKRSEEMVITRLEEKSSPVLLDCKGCSASKPKANSGTMFNESDDLLLSEESLEAEATNLSQLDKNYEYPANSKLSNEMEAIPCSLPCKTSETDDLLQNIIGNNEIAMLNSNENSKCSLLHDEKKVTSENEGTQSLRLKCKTQALSQFSPNISDSLRDLLKSSSTESLLAPSELDDTVAWSPSHIPFSPFNSNMCWNNMPLPLITPLSSLSDCHSENINAPCNNDVAHSETDNSSIKQTVCTEISSDSDEELSSSSDNLSSVCSSENHTSVINDNQSNSATQSSSVASGTSCTSSDEKLRRLSRIDLKVPSTYDIKANLSLSELSSDHSDESKCASSSLYDSDCPILKTEALDIYSSAYSSKSEKHLDAVQSDKGEPSFECDKVHSPVDIKKNDLPCGDMCDASPVINSEKRNASSTAVAAYFHAKSLTGAVISATGAETLHSTIVEPEISRFTENDRSHDREQVDIYTLEKCFNKSSLITENVITPLLDMCKLSSTSNAENFSEVPPKLKNPPVEEVACASANEPETFLFSSSSCKICKKPETASVTKDLVPITSVLASTSYKENEVCKISKSASSTLNTVERTKNTDILVMGVDVKDSDGNSKSSIEITNTLPVKETVLVGHYPNGQECTSACNIGISSITTGISETEKVQDQRVHDQRFQNIVESKALKSLDLQSLMDSCEQGNLEETRHTSPDDMYMSCSDAEDTDEDIIVKNLQVSCANDIFQENGLKERSSSYYVKQGVKRKRSPSSNSVEIMPRNVNGNENLNAEQLISNAETSSAFAHGGSLALKKRACKIFAAQQLPEGGFRKDCGLISVVKSETNKLIEHHGQPFCGSLATSSNTHQRRPQRIISTRTYARNLRKRVPIHGLRYAHKKRMEAFKAAEEGSTLKLQELVQDVGPGIREEKSNQTLLHTAAAHNQVDVVMFLLRLINPNVVNSERQTPAHIAARMGHTQVLRILLSDEDFCHEKLDINGRTYKDLLSVPLFNAVLDNNKTRVQELLRLGANPDCDAGCLTEGRLTPNIERSTARQLATHLNCKAILQVFPKEDVKPIVKKLKTPSVTFTPEAINFNEAEGEPYPQPCDMGVSLVKEPNVGDEIYKLDSMPRGFLCILNYNTFKERPDLNLEGSAMDISNIVNVFSKMGYAGEVYSSLTADETNDVLMDLLDKNILKDVGCLIIIINSHSVGDDHFLTSDLKVMNMNETCDRFTNSECPSMINKPKIFIYNTCGGLYKEHKRSRRGKSSNTRVREYPCDTLSLFSSSRGLASYNYSDNGTPFIFALCSTLAKHAHRMEINELFREFLKEYNMSSPVTMPELRNVGFRKSFYFNPTDLSQQRDVL